MKAESLKVGSTHSGLLTRQVVTANSIRSLWIWIWIYTSQEPEPVNGYEREGKSLQQFGIYLFTVVNMFVDARYLCRPESSTKCIVTVVT